ncbi:glutaredoxin family protein [Solibacillus ferritrahens]|uniref:glutaredoxin family protein n=1 Tax=Solibacillus ferritrahens TaxID=3098620 RepID=UPI00300971E3
MSKTEVIIYGANWCVHCSNAKDWLDKENIPYEFKNIDKPQNKAYLKDLNVQGIPFIEVKTEGMDTVHIQGFNPDQLLDTI